MLEKKRAVRKAAKEKAAKLTEERIRRASSLLVERFEDCASKKNILSSYGGDMFSTHGNYIGGMMYLSRMSSAVQTQAKVSLRSNGTEHESEM